MLGPVGVANVMDILSESAMDVVHLVAVLCVVLGSMGVFNVMDILCAMDLVFLPQLPTQAKTSTQFGF